MTVDPFALPAQTNARFWLLVVATLASGSAMTAIDISAFPALERIAPALTVTQSLGSIGAIVVLALLIWWVYPWAKIRRRRLRPIPSRDHGTLVATLTGLCAEVGQHPPPTFLWNPLRLDCTAIAFGRRRRSYVGLTGGLVVEFHRDPEAFRAILLHELAHLRNGDLGITYFTMALWWSFVAIVLVPFVLFGLLPNLLRPTLFAPLDWLGVWWWRIVALSLLVYLTRNAVLHTRETYADLRAAAWCGPSGALRRVLARLPRRRWAVLRPHPDPERRLRLLDDASPLFRAGFWEAFGTGLALAIANFGLLGHTAILVGSGVVVAVLVGLDALVTSGAAAGVIGLAIWRDSYLAAAAGRRSRRWMAAGAGLGAGLVLGPALSLDAAVLDVTGRGRFAGVRLAPSDLPVDAIAIVGALLAARWIAGTAGPWLTWRLSGVRPRLAYAVGLLATTAVLGGFVGLTSTASLLLTARPTADSLRLLALAAFATPPAAVLLVIAWALPLSAAIEGGGLRGVRRQLVAGIGVGLAFWPVYLVDVLVLRLPVLSSPIVAICVVQAVVGFAIGRGDREPATSRALFTAFVTACVTLPLGLLTLPAPSPAELVLATCAWLNAGAIVAFAFARLGHALAGRRRHANAGASAR